MRLPSHLNLVGSALLFAACSSHQVLHVGAPALGASSLPEPLTAAATAQDGLSVRVVDVGGGLCCVARWPGPERHHYMVYDAGNFVDSGSTAIDAVREILGEDVIIDLLVLSHSDADHLAATPEICDEYDIHRIWRTGMERTTATWTNANTAILAEEAGGSCEVVDLTQNVFAPGSTYKLGDAFLTMVCGFGDDETLEAWDNEFSLNLSEERNAVSIVVRLLYKDISILFCGDAVGRHNGDDDDDAPIATEAFMLEMAAVIEIDSDVLIAPHHGADNGSSLPFIEAVSPEFVIFSAGHKHEHPRDRAAQRYLNSEVSIENIFRTDRGDNEGDDEWGHQASSTRDGRGDDDVEIRVSAAGVLSVLQD